MLSLDEAKIPNGSLRHDTRLMLTKPVHILKEWRLWVVDERVVTWSLYKEGQRVVYRHEIDADVLDFAQSMVDANPGYSPAYVIYDNYEIILKWNRSLRFALAVCTLKDKFIDEL